MIEPQGDQHDVDIRLPRIGNDRRRRVRLDAGPDVPGVQATSGDRVRAITMRKDRDAVTRRTKLSAIDRANDSRADNQNVHIAISSRALDEHVTTAAMNDLGTRVARVRLGGW